MASYYTETIKNTMLDAFTPSHCQLHSGDPGAAGTSNAVGVKQAGTFAAASGGSRALNAQIDFTGLSANQAVSWFSVWGEAGATFYARGELTGDSNANASGEFSLTTATSLSITDDTA